MQHVTKNKRIRTHIHTVFLILNGEPHRLISQMTCTHGSQIQHYSICVRFETTITIHKHDRLTITGKNNWSQQKWAKSDRSEPSIMNILFLIFRFADHLSFNILICSKIARNKLCCVSHYGLTALKIPAFHQRTRSFAAKAATVVAPG